MGRLICRAVLLLTVLVILMMYLIRTARPNIPTSASVSPVVVIDPGHGGFDGGAVGLGELVEKDFTLSICLLLEQKFEQLGITTLMTRRTDDGLDKSKQAKIRKRKQEDIKERERIINQSGAQLFLSIHANKFEDSKQRGAQIFYAKNNPNSETLAIKIGDKIAQTMPEANIRIPLPVPSSVYLFKNPKMPACLIECGFVTNPIDYAHMLDVEFQTKLAATIADSVKEFLEVSQ